MVKIRNKKTGEIREIPDEQASQYGINPTPTQAPQNNQEGSMVRSASDLLRLLGLGAFPGAAATAYELPGFVGRGMKPRRAEEAVDNPFISPEQVREKIDRPGESMAREGAGLASWLIGGPLAAGGRAARIATPFIEGALQTASQPGAGAGDVVTGAGLSGGVAKILGLLAHPIASATGRVDEILRNSPAKIDIGDILSDYRSKVLPEFERKTVGRAAQEAYNTDIMPNITTAATGYRQHIPADISTSFDSNMNSLEVPIAGANEMKRNVSGSVRKYYGAESNKVEVESRKQLARLLKEAIESKEPSVSKYNKIATLLNKVPDAAEQLSYILPNYRTQALLRGVGSLPAKGIQKAIPADGGYLQRLLPLLYNTSIQNAQIQEGEVQ